MVQKIDAELARLAKLGHTPKSIEVGEDLYEAMYEEQNPPVIAAIVGPGEKAPVHIDKEVTEYDGVRVFRMSNVTSDHLNISY